MTFSFDFFSFLLIFLLSFLLSRSWSCKRGFQSREESDVTAADAPPHVSECATNLKTRKTRNFNEKTHQYQNKFSFTPKMYFSEWQCIICLPSVYIQVLIDMEGSTFIWNKYGRVYHIWNKWWILSTHLLFIYCHNRSEDLMRHEWFHQPLCPPPPTESPIIMLFIIPPDHHLVHSKSKTRSLDLTHISTYHPLNTFYNCSL